MKHKEINTEVLVTSEAITKVAQPDIEFLKKRVALSPRKRIRFCAHPASDHNLHEMMIVLAKGTYVRPHKHDNKVESFHIIEGAVDVILFEESGTIHEVIRMGDYTSGKNFYYRLAEPRYHTLILRSDLLILHETTNGPFKKSDTIFAPWAPEEGDEKGIAKFMQKLAESVAPIAH